MHAGMFIVQERSLEKAAARLVQELFPLLFEALKHSQHGPYALGMLVDKGTLDMAPGVLALVKEVSLGVEALQHLWAWLVQMQLKHLYSSLL